MNIHQGKQFVSEPQPNTVLQGDCVEVMRRFRSCSVNFVLTDPPYLAHYCSRECTYKMLFEIGRAPSVETIDCASSPSQGILREVIRLGTSKPRVFAVASQTIETDQQEDTEPIKVNS